MTAQWTVSEGDNCALIVAHPSDEVLWAGGTMLLHPDVRWTVVALYKEDDEKAAKFIQAAEQLGAKGYIADIEAKAKNTPPSMMDIENIIMETTPVDRLELVITHGLWADFSKHQQHEETAKAVLALRKIDRLVAKELWTFAYEDGDGKYSPKPIKTADIFIRLPEDLWQKKYDIVTKVYGFDSESDEAKATPRQEAFWRFG